MSEDDWRQCSPIIQASAASLIICMGHFGASTGLMFLLAIPINWTLRSTGRDKSDEKIMITGYGVAVP
ncbi:hypothetical protein BDD12DRAFT_875954 [Trichophaea hybrida]|nr:hypothetical protein BDD12DRAFT_875954 [Trichophaea hybrida]